MNYSAAFEAFWQAYKCMRRVKKLEAWSQWVAQGCEENAEEVMAGLARFKLTPQWRDAFQPEPARWLKNQRWTDEAEPQDEAQDDAGWSPTGPPKGGV